jgi:hypothetical protein
VLHPVLLLVVLAAAVAVAKEKAAAALVYTAKAHLALERLLTRLPEVAVVVVVKAGAHQIQAPSMVAGQGQRVLLMEGSVQFVLYGPEHVDSTHQRVRRMNKLAGVKNEFLY